MISAWAMHRTGSCVTEANSARASGACSAGASVSISICNASKVAEPDRYTAERAGEALPAGAEGDDADNEEHRRDRRDIERQDLHDQRRADIGAEQLGLVSFIRQV